MRIRTTLCWALGLLLLSALPAAGSTGEHARTYTTTLLLHDWLGDSKHQTAKRVRERIFRLRESNDRDRDRENDHAGWQRLQRGDHFPSLDPQRGYSRDNTSYQTPSATNLPEPTTGALLGSGLVLLTALGRRQRGN